MSARRLGTVLAAAAVVVTAQLGTPSLAQAKVAHAHGSMVFAKSGNVYVARADGSGAHLVKKGGYGWVTIDRHGVISALAPDGIVSPDGSAGYSIYRMNQHGKVLSRTATPADYSTLDYLAYPPRHVAVSPNGTKTAYDLFLGDQFVSLWSPSKRMSFAGQGAGQEGYGSPVWLDNKRILLSSTGVRIAGGEEMGVYTVGAGQDSVQDWFSADSWATGFEATATSNGKKIAILEDDSADYIDGVARNFRLVLMTSGGILQPVTRKCTFALPLKNFGSYVGAATDDQFNFDATGSTLAFMTNYGIWRANTRNLDNCSTVKPHMWIKGGYAPAFSAADLQR
ncbi:MAG: hypothetical protein QOF82_2225 [Frankiales bacterium]|nr:hypothetical protein [Frankiales bacterium]